MAKYIVVANRPNQMAAIHLATCPHLGENSLLQTPSADRYGYDDGLAAVSAAKSAMPKNHRFCGHCLPKFRWLLSN